MVKDRVGLSELNDNKNNLGKALIAELVGTFILNFFGCISVMNLLDQSTPANLVLISLSFGLSVMAMVQVRLLWTITITLLKLHLIVVTCIILLIQYQQWRRHLFIIFIFEIIL